MVTNVSIVIEWENVLLSGDSRAKRMLGRVIEQANSLPICREILISATDQQTNLEERPPELRADISWRLIVNPSSHYYDLKNLGARDSTCEVIVFIDSDVIPEPEWLEQLLAPFEDTSTQVSCGRAYIEPNNLYNKAFALFWFFPIRPKAAEMAGSSSWANTDHFFANNIAFRRDTVLRHPFVAGTVTSRGACLDLAKDLKLAKIPIVLNKQALVAHPPPLPGKHFILRALAQGRDCYLRGHGVERNIFLSCWRWVWNSGRTVLKITWLHRRVKLPLIQVPLAWLIGLTYYGLYWVGEVATMLRVRQVLDITI